MSERQKFEYSKLPERVGLKEAIKFNQILWRRRSHFQSLSSPIELPEKVSKPVFQKVLETFKGSVERNSEANFPLVGYSLLPEMPFSIDEGFYYPNMEKFRSIKLFEEFGTEWLAQVVLGNDPYDSNIYLPVVQKSIKETPETPESIFLMKLLNSLDSGLVLKEEITKIFVNLLLEGNFDISKEIFGNFKGENKSLYEIVHTNGLKDENLEDLMHKMDVKNKFVRELYKPIIFTALSTLQLMMAGTMGLVGIPGVINISGAGISSFEHVLIHEYLHQLSFHEKSCGSAVPINGYFKGSVLNLKG